ncbi:calcium homeostasis modulator protein 6 [Dasypus novemcinctus]|uniref:calcium homeostasis modulator protein 6 n=1 Tax=Dasypus novemcinctus TaxID=9361 RepID=UPI000328FEC0|nr:calcium homeostasis modulator protein 6 [Dasypus novemcinctus]
MEKFRSVLDLHLKYRHTLGYGLVTLLTAGGERIFSTVVFQCPCNAWNLSYGLVFLLVPALVLFLLGYVLSARTWRLLTGCCRSRTRRGCGAALRGTLVCAQLSCVAAVAPVTWVAVALLGGTFYECAVSGSADAAQRLCPPLSYTCALELRQVPCQQAETKEVQDLLSVLKAESQVIGWMLIAAVIIFILIVKAVTRCFSPVSFLQLKFWKIYLEQEQQMLQTEATLHATELAKENVKCFFDSTHPKVYSTPSIKDWQQISALYTFSPKDQYYSMLHKYVNREEKNHSIRSLGEVVPVLGFVDTPGLNTTAEL